jgi:hypothetical protein
LELLTPKPCVATAGSVETDFHLSAIILIETIHEFFTMTNCAPSIRLFVVFIRGRLSPHPAARTSPPSPKPCVATTGSVEADFHLRAVILTETIHEFFTNTRIARSPFVYSWFSFVDGLPVRDCACPAVFGRGDRVR